MLWAFQSAAESGPLLWAGDASGGMPHVCGGAVPPAGVVHDVGRLFVEALRARFGVAASGIAEREWRLGEQPCRLLPARTVRHAVACAETALSLLQAQAQVLQLEFSAVLGGWRFRRVADSVGLDPAALSSVRRQTLDQLLAPHVTSPLPANAEAVARQLRLLLTTGWQ